MPVQAETRVQEWNYTQRPNPLSGKGRVAGGRILGGVDQEGDSEWDVK